MNVLFKELVKSHNDWAIANLQNRTILSSLQKFLEESIELEKAIVENGSISEIGFEIADVIISAISIGERCGIDHELLEVFITNKISINKERKFKEVGNGIYKHIK